MPSSKANWNLNCQRTFQIRHDTTLGDGAPEAPVENGYFPQADGDRFRLSLQVRYHFSFSPFFNAVKPSQVDDAVSMDSKKVFRGEFGLPCFHGLPHQCAAGCTPVNPGILSVGRNPKNVFQLDPLPTIGSFQEKRSTFNRIIGFGFGCIRLGRCRQGVG